jgi:hypothetical protein
MDHGWEEDVVEVSVPVLQFNLQDSIIIDATTGEYIGFELDGVIDDRALNKFLTDVHGFENGAINFLFVLEVMDDDGTVEQPYLKGK